MSDAPRRSGDGRSGDGPPRRPELSIAPMRPPRPDGLGPWSVVAIAGWFVAAVLVVITAVVVATHRQVVQQTIRGGVLHDHPEKTFSDVDHATSIALAVGAGAAALVVLLALLGMWRLSHHQRSGRNTLIVDAFLLILLAVGFWLMFIPRYDDLVRDGIFAPFFWIVYVAAGIGVLATAVTFAPSVASRLRD